MLLSDTSVRRPVLAFVACALLLAFGLLSFERLALREYPNIDAPVLSVVTEYRGASAAVVENKITEVIEARLAGIEGVKTLSSKSADGRSDIVLEFNLTRDIDDAANDVRDRISRVFDQLPEEATPPEVRKSEGDEQVILWVNLADPSMSSLELTDYARRYLVDRFSVLDGVARIRVSGQQIYSMRVWLDRDALVARRLTVTDVETAIRAQNIELPAGTLKSVARDFIVRIDRGFVTEQDFRELVVSRGEGGYLTRLGDIARVELAPAEERNIYRGNGQGTVGLGIIKQSNANALTVARLVKREMARINPTLPGEMRLVRSFDSSVFVEEAVNEVFQTLFIAAGLVVLVIFLFLGDLRSVLVPAFTVPISLISTFTTLWLFDYSINMLTLLALVLAIGLVVDDSIVVLENIHRRLLAGETPLVAAFHGARQVGFAVIATTAVLVAVFVPITFLEGDVGRLFGEFAVTMAMAVVFSSFVALTLAPVIGSRFFRADKLRNPLARTVERLSAATERAYRRILTPLIQRPRVALAVVPLTLAMAFFLFDTIPEEYTPAEDRGVVFVSLKTPEGSSFAYTERHLLDLEARLLPLVEAGDIKRLLLRAPGFGNSEEFNSGFAILILEDWDSGRRSTAEIQRDVVARTRDIVGARIFVGRPSSLGGRNTPPVQFVVGGQSYDQLAEWQDLLLEKIAENPGLVNVDSDLKPTKPQLRVTIDRNRAGDLGVRLEDIGRSLETLLGSRRVTTFVMGGREYDVILEGEREAQRTLTDLNGIYVRSTTSGELIPLGNLVQLREQADAATLNRYNRIRSLTLTADLAGDYRLGEALEYLQELVRTELPETASFDFKGESLEYYTSSSSVFFTFLIALLVVYLVMAAQFESFVHPLMIMTTVPAALIGGLLGLALFGQSINIYSQVGLIMLLGLAAKNGILIVEFINQKRDEGLPFDEALLAGASQRLRPIVMTAFTTVLGALPLILSAGPGHETRTVIGIVVMGGVALSTPLTLLLVPMVYAVLGRGTDSPQAVSRRLRRELGGDGLAAADRVPG